MSCKIPYFLTVLSALFFLSVVNLDTLAQQPDNTNNLQNTFGFSLERPDKKKKRKSMQAIADRRPDEIGLVRIDTALVVNEILVQDKKGAVIRGLQQNDFAVKEDSVPQNIEVFATGGESRIPRSIILIIDYSFSELPYIATSVEAAKLLVDKLNPFDQMALVTDDVELLSDFTSNKELLKEKLDSLKAKALVGNVGRSKQYSALMAALNELFPARTLRPVILFQTDGDQLSDFTGYGNEAPDFRGKEDKEPFKRLLSGLEETGATVYTIVPGPCFTVPSKKQRLRNAELAILARAAHLADLQKGVGKELPQNLSSSYVSLFANTRQRDELALEQLSRKSGGVLEHLETPADADAVYSSILSQMNNRYVIGYYPTNQERDGMRRRVEIRLRANSDYIIWGRKTYVAPDSGR